MMNDAKLVFRSAKNFFSFEFSEDRGSRLLIVDCSRFAENASEEFSRMSGHPSGPCQLNNHSEIAASRQIKYLTNLLPYSDTNVGTFQE